MGRYLKRCIDAQLTEKLASSGAVLIKGPKWCGKSTSAEQVARSAVYMQKANEREQNIALAKNAPEIFLSGDAPKLIDEWQVIPFIWDDIRYEIDHRGLFGQFILTGSTTPLSDKDGKQRIHSGIGRITTLTMRTMSLYESLESNGAFSLGALFEGKAPKAAASSKTLVDYAFLACRGGWPLAVGLDERTALNVAKNYYDGLISDDFRNLIGAKRDIEKMEATLRAYARNISTECSLDTLLRDVKENDDLSISDESIRSYLNLLREIYVIEDVPAWNPNLRSKTAIRTTPTRHFVDPSVGCRALGIGPNALIGDLRTFGLVFEDLAVRDLKVYAEKLGGQVYHYRDRNGLEADAVIHLDDGRWAAFEVKLHDSDAIGLGAEHLLKLSRNIDDEKMKKPSFLAVISATEYAYRRDDGVFVIPLACLKD